MPRIISILFALAAFSFTLFSCASRGSPGASESPNGYLARNAPVTEFDDWAAASGESGRTRTSENIQDNRMISYTVFMELSVKNSDETRELLNEQVENHNGFIVRITDNAITARIPSEQMENYLVYARTLGEVRNETKTGTDITDQYRDNVIRLENLRTIRTRYLALLERAESVSDILSIERELERINVQIDIMEGRIRHAELSTAYSSVTVRFSERARPGPVSWVFYGLYQGIKWLFIWD